MKKLIITTLILLLIATMATAAWGYDVNQGEDTWLYYSDGTRAAAIFDAASVSPITTMSIGNPAVIFTWENGYLDVIYEEGLTKTEAAEQFFEWLKQYINETHTLTPRKTRK